MKNLVKLVILLIIIAGLIIAVTMLPVKDWLFKLLQLTEQLGVWGPVLVVGFYIIACVLFLPGSILTLGAGFIFKLLIGTITVSVGSTLGACAAFLVGRSFGRKWIADKVAKNQKFTALDTAVAQEGFKIVFLVRLSPVFPFNLLNYAFGLTKVSFAKYALASWIGMLPGTIMFVYFGAGLRSLADATTENAQTGIAGQIFFWFGLVIAIAVTVFVTRLGRNALRKTVATEKTDEI